MTIRMRETYLERAFNLPDSGTRITDINLVDPIQDIMIKMEATNGSINNIQNPLFNCITLIEVVDGSDVLYSLKPGEAMALGAYHFKESLEWGIDERADEHVGCVFKIPFGVGRHDYELGLDPTRFNNPQLRVSFNLEAIRECGGTGFVTGSLYETVIASVVDRAPSRPSGFLMTKHIHEFETAGAGDYYIDMPTDYPHRAVFVRVKESHAEGQLCPWSIITQAKYSCDQDKYIPFNFLTDDWENWLKEWYGFWHQGEYFQISAGVSLCRHDYLPGNNAIALTSYDQEASPFWSGGCGCTKCISMGVGETTNVVHVKANGTLPFSTWCYPFGDQDDHNEWLSMADIEHVRFTLTQGNEDDLCQVFLTQKRTY